MYKIVVMTTKLLQAISEVILRYVSTILLGHVDHIFD